MTPHLHRLIPHSCQPALTKVRRFPHRKWFLIPLAALVLALSLASCSGGGSPKSQAPVTDTRPVGEGLKVIGFALLGASVVLVLGKMLRP
jgi:hypothetical protein